MRNLVPPVIDSKTIYQSIAKRARDTDNIDKHTRLNTLEPLIISRYAEYEKEKKNLENISESTITDEKDRFALESCYNRNSEGYLEGEVVSKILSTQSAQHRNSCPYCGIDKPRTIDHYLPKSIFPEYAIYPPNLIPCCGRCNSKKSFAWINEGKRIFINFYYDVIPQARFLFTQLIFDKDERIVTPAVVFDLRNDGNISQADFEMIKRHFSKLELLIEYAETIEEELSNIYDRISHNTHMPMQLHQEELDRTMKMYQRKYGLNYWKACLIDSIIQSKEFFNRIYKVVA